MPVELRSEPRLHVNIDVAVVLPGNPNARVSGRLVDISQSGARLLVSSPVCVGGIIMAEWGPHFLLGKTRHVRQTAMGYLLGLRLDACSWWPDQARSNKAAAQEIFDSSALPDRPEQPAPNAEGVI